MKNFTFIIGTLFIFSSSFAQQTHASNMKRSQIKLEQIQTIQAEIDPPVYPKLPIPPKP